MIIIDKLFIIVFNYNLKKKEGKIQINFENDTYFFVGLFRVG